MAHRYKDTNCEPVLLVLGQNGKDHTSENTLMTSTCLNNASYTDKEGCRQSIGASYDSILPVFGSDQHIYKNSFCARCNFVEEFELVNLTAYCKKFAREYKNPYQRFMNCSFKIFRSKIVKSSIKTCNKIIFNRWVTCNKTNKYYDMCSSYLGIMGSVANYHCLLCNDTDVNTSSQKVPKFLYSKYFGKKAIAEDTGPSVNQPWSFTINFGEETNITIKGIEFSSKTYCENRDVYNFISSTCETFSSPKGYKKCFTKCFKDKFVLQNLIRFNKTALFNRCFTPSNISMIINNVTNYSKESKAPPNDMLRMLLKLTLHELKIMAYYIFGAARFAFSEKK